jgi:hypothetical protein
MTDALKTQVLRSIDKWDRNGPEGTFALLTDGKTDQSGAFIPGCGLQASQAVMLVAFLQGNINVVSSRLDMMDKLDSIETGPFRSALDDLCAVDHSNWAHRLDDLIALANGRSPPPSAADWDWTGFLQLIQKSAGTL